MVGIRNKNNYIPSFLNVHLLQEAYFYSAINLRFIKIILDLTSMILNVIFGNGLKKNIKLKQGIYR